MSYLPERGRVAQQVDGMLAALEQAHPGRQDALRLDTVGELDSWPDVVVQLVDAAPYAEACQVAGRYERRGEVAYLIVARAESQPRVAFSALHEYGHALQRTTRALNRVLADEPAGDRQLEERACNEFAARILLPDDLLAHHIGDRGPTAAEVVALMRTRRASRRACCIAASRRLRAPGHVLLLDADGQLLFPASIGLPPPTPGSDQSRCSLIAQALRSRGPSRADDAQLDYRDGDWRGEQLFGDAAWHGEYLVAVLTTDHLPWGGLAVRASDPSSAGAAGPTARLVDCEQCGDPFPAHHRCSRCRDPRCPQCGYCTCTKQVTTTCEKCYLTLSDAEQRRGLTKHDECP